MNLVEQRRKACNAGKGADVWCVRGLNRNLGRRVCGLLGIAECKRKMRPIRFNSAILLGMIGLLTQLEPDFCVCACAGESLRVEGTLVYTAAPTPTHGADEERYSVDLKVDGRIWSIQMIPTDAAKRPIKYTEIGCDGETICAYLEQNQEVIPPKFTNGVAVVPANQGVAMMFAGSVPSPMYFRCEALWLAYCSAWQFVTNSSGKACQLWLGGNVPLNGVVDNYVNAEWNWVSERRRFLSHVAYFPERTSGGSRRYPLVTFDVIRTQLLQGIEVPVEFTFVRYDETELAKRIPFVSFTFNVSKVTHVDIPVVPKPKIKVPVMLMDFRFSKDAVPVPLIQQIVRDGVWPGRAAVASSKNYAIAKRVVKTGNSDPSMKPKKGTILSILAANALVLAIVAGVKLKRTKNRKAITRK